MPNSEYQKFADTLSDDFSVSLESGETLALNLAEVSALKQQDEFSHFSLIFNGPKTTMLPQGMYPINHHQIGLSHIFLVPMEKHDTHCSYQAVFNLKSAA